MSISSAVLGRDSTILGFPRPGGGEGGLDEEGALTGVEALVVARRAGVTRTAV